MSLITAIATANPANRFGQHEIEAFMLKAMAFQNGESRKLRAIFKASGIDYRYSVLADYGRTGNFEFYSENLEEAFPSTRERLGIFRNHALPLSVQACTKLFLSAPHIDRAQITHLIVVCCTGMYAPGLDIELVTALKLPTTTDRTAINFMGCYAAFNALKIADAICTSNVNAKVLVVCTELCSLHFQREATDDNLLANALFGDGCAALLVENQSESRLQLRLSGFHNDLATAGNTDMAWTVGDLGFEMKLSAYVPDVIRKGIGRLTGALLQKLQQKIADIAHFAIHPGGKKILQVIEDELGIGSEKNEPAYYVLKNYGNMSSPTVLFVIARLVEELRGKKEYGEDILSFAFGPGLTMESMILKIEKV
ncbi:MAG TPA: type III polyketide synthase [Chryseosolibacter sp.]|nr:type III polyketide synthase [Chryseosolibacter sp.]